MAWCGGSPLPVVEVIMKKQESSPKRQEDGSVITKNRCFHRQKINLFQFIYIYIYFTADATIYIIYI